eukprot:1979931-Rhodomonas_salina.2
MRGRGWEIKSAAASASSAAQNLLSLGFTSTSAGTSTPVTRSQCWSCHGSSRVGDDDDAAA